MEKSAHNMKDAKEMRMFLCERERLLLIVCSSIVHNNRSRKLKVTQLVNELAALKAIWMGSASWQTANDSTIPLKFINVYMDFILFGIKEKEKVFAQTARATIHGGRLNKN